MLREQGGEDCTTCRGVRSGCSGTYSLDTATHTCGDPAQHGIGALVPNGGQIGAGFGDFDAGATLGVHVTVCSIGPDSVRLGAAYVEAKNSGSHRISADLVVFHCCISSN